jgi:uncharacterized membrane protein YgaE (UPF0421/DUF939 family)
MLKTGIAVTLALYVSAWLQFMPSVIAAVAAIFAMQPSIYRSWRYFLDQVQTNTLGAIAAMLAGTYLSSEPIAIGAVCILVIMVCMKFKMEETIGLTLVTVVAVMDASGNWEFALNRFLLSLIGIVSAFVINVAFLPPNPRTQFHRQMRSVYDQLSLLLRTVISDEMQEKVFRKQKKELQDQLASLAEKYKLMEEEQKKVKRPKYSQKRELAVDKQFLHTLHTGFEVLEAVQEHFFQAERTDHLNKSYDQHLERVIRHHEQVLLRFEQKLKPDNRDSARFAEENDQFMKETADCYNENKEGFLRLMIVAAAIYNYGYQTVRLSRMVRKVKPAEETIAGFWRT